MIQDPGDRSVAVAHTPNPALNGYPAKPESAGLPPRPLYSVCLELRQKVDNFLAENPKTAILRDVQVRVREAIGVVDEAFRRYGPDEISISYNGGKDCLVLLIIILACLARRYPPPSEDQPSQTPDGSADPGRFPDKFQAVYIVSLHPFSEIDEFVVSSSAEYHLEVARYELGMKQGLESYLADRPNIKAIFVGTRRTDPHGEKLTNFDPTDAGWPDFMRVHPVIDWHYAEIWAVSFNVHRVLQQDEERMQVSGGGGREALTQRQFIRHLDIPYCPLYDQGYTSLGGTKDTHPNPHLKRQGSNGGGFLPAYELIGDDEERLGRDR
ncbi:adenine nucleotide alpha hydrolases-like protein [Xylariaceae sp. FL1651]|nr:adenine nucleotide alpha hydrolases-like protein [Xylariaceae sp. FL1651]